MVIHPIVVPRCTVHFIVRNIPSITVLRLSQHPHPALAFQSLLLRRYHSSSNSRRLSSILSHSLSSSHPSREPQSGPPRPRTNSSSFHLRRRQSPFVLNLQMSTSMTPTLENSSARRRAPRRG